MITLRIGYTALPYGPVLRASWCHAADWAHSRVAFTSSQGTNSPAHAGLGLRPSLRSKLPYGPVLRASWCHAADWAHSRVAFTSSQGTNSPAHAGLGLRPSLRSKLPYGPVLRASWCHAAAASQRAASLRLGQIPAPLGGSWAFALAPVHPRCFARLRASGLDEIDQNSSPVSYHTSGPLSTRFFS